MVTAEELLFGENDKKPVFNDRSQIKSWIQNRLMPLGILIVIERSDVAKIVFKCKSYRYSSSFKKVRQKRVSKKQKLLLQQQGLLETLELQQKDKQKKAKKNSNCSCPFRIRANYSVRTNKWTIVIVNGKHNHPLKNCQSNAGEFFNDDSFNRDIQVNLVKKRFHTNPHEPEMIEDKEIKNASVGTVSSKSLSFSNASSASNPSTPNSLLLPSYDNSTSQMLLGVNLNQASSVNLSDSYSVSSPISSCDNSMEDFLSTRGSSAHLTAAIEGTSNIDQSINHGNYNFSDDWKFTGNQEVYSSSYASPFFEPVRDDQLPEGISTVNSLIDDFFTRNSGAPQQSMDMMNRNMSMNMNQNVSYVQLNDSTQELPRSKPEDTSFNFSKIDDISMRANYNSTMPFMTDSAFNNVHNNMLSNLDYGVPACPVINMNDMGMVTDIDMNNYDNSEPQFSMNGNMNATNGNEDYSNIPITTFVDDCPAMY
ncbi:DNA-binding transcription factor [Saccharomycopsis crataegensis]|uniref:DNA-binding transcription factor n=1 Tax=Saccharomycopsis crataegensis TaxID=43959 RepID=A0AAV5QW11_9ASCO|nr:DNA-binding transcription factor [Saccharomycopsis crataegensis]